MTDDNTIGRRVVEVCVQQVIAAVQQIVSSQEIPAPEEITVCMWYKKNDVSRMGVEVKADASPPCDVVAVYVSGDVNPPEGYEYSKDRRDYPTWIKYIKV